MCMYTTYTPAALPECLTPWENLSAHTMQFANEALMPASGAKGNKADGRCREPDLKVLASACSCMQGT